MKRHEYRVEGFTHRIAPANLQAHLNQLGSEGWRFASMMRTMLLGSDDEGGRGEGLLVIAERRLSGDTADVPNGSSTGPPIVE